jgi:hypothetical protein
VGMVVGRKMGFIFVHPCIAFATQFTYKESI